jgi:hypothetical protein
VNPLAAFLIMTGVFLLLCALQVVRWMVEDWRRGDGPNL